MWNQLVWDRGKGGEGSSIVVNRPQATSFLAHP